MHDKTGRKAKRRFSGDFYDVRNRVKATKFNVSIMSTFKEYSYFCHHFIITLLLPCFDHQSVPGQLAALVRWLHFRGLELRGSTV